MEYDIDDTGKLINARRKEELIRCRDCINRQYDSIFHVGWCKGKAVKPTGCCNEGSRSNHNCNRFGGGVYHMAKMEMRLNEITYMANRICLWGWCDCFFVLDGREIRLNESQTKV